IIVAFFAGVGGWLLLGMGRKSDNVCDNTVAATLIVSNKFLDTETSSDGSTSRCDICLKRGIAISDYFYASSSLTGAYTSGDKPREYCDTFTVDQSISMYILSDEAVSGPATCFSGDVTAVTPDQRDSACTYGGFQKTCGYLVFCLVPVFIVWGVVGCIKGTTRTAATVAGMGAAAKAVAGSLSQKTNPMSTSNYGQPQPAGPAYAPSPATGPVPAPVPVPSPYYPPQGPAQAVSYAAPAPAPTTGVYAAYGQAPAPAPAPYGQQYGPTPTNPANPNNICPTPTNPAPAPAYMQNSADQAFY
ncbi:hypothetical protein KIPB_009350, partial [Kipferlia bialata]